MREISVPWTGTILIRLLLLEEQLETVNRMARADELPDAIITESGLKITPLANAVPEEADALMQQAYGLLPHVKITELLMEVNEWTGFTRHFTHIKSGNAASDKTLLLTAILADKRLFVPGKPADHPALAALIGGTINAKHIRLAPGQHISAGKKAGAGGAKMGNAHLKWVFSQAAALLIRSQDPVKIMLQRHTQKYGKPGAMRRLTQKLSRTVYYMIRNQRLFDQDRFLQE